jgi:peptide/nickel transport system substrate-binding protein
MSMPTIRRREFLKLSALTAVSLALEACAKATPTPTPTPKPAPTKVAATVAPTVAPTAAPTAAPTKVQATAAPIVKYQESPMLAEMVKAGKIPTIENRLPQDPRVVYVVERIGKFGGTWRRAYKGISDRWGPTKLMEEAMVQWRWDDAGVQIAPNTCSKWEMNADATSYTFFLRKGIRWSDGEEFNTDDVKFWYEDVWQNTTLISSPKGTASWLCDPDGTPMKVEIVDKYTFKCNFGKPKPLLPIFTAKLTGTSPVGPSFALPEHYMKKFHAKYANKDDLDKQLKDRKFATWDLLWNNAAGDMQGPIAFWFLNPDRPVINAWRPKVAPSAGGQMVMERNPFFWKVDAMGNQLPYVDTITHDYFDNQEVFNMWLISGKIDCQYRHVDVGSYTLYKENEKKGGYRVIRWRAASTQAFYPNITCPDEVLAKLFDTPKFRQALSIAINRNELNELVYNGLYTARQASPVKGSPNYDADFAKKWAEYSPDQANKLLDELNLTKGADGVRKRPDGKPLEVIVEVSNALTGLNQAEAERVCKYWTAIGVKATMKLVERSLYEEHYRTGDVQIGAWGCDRNSIVMADPGRYLGTTSDGTWAVLYGNWYGKSPYKQKEPPADHAIRKVWDAWDKCQVEPDETKRNALFKSIIDIHKENPWMIGTVGENPTLWITQNKFRNVPEGRIQDDTLRDYGLSEPWQFFFDA